MSYYNAWSSTVRSVAAIVVAAVAWNLVLPTAACAEKGEIVLNVVMVED